MTMRNLLSAFAFMLVPLCGWAGPVDVETARQQAMNFFSQHSSSQSKRRAMAAPKMKLLHVQQQKPDEQPLLYVFGQEEGEGYAIIAGDDAAINPVLGYSTTGTFREDSIPCCLHYLLDEYSRQLEFARQSPQSVRRAANRASSRVNIAPLIKSKWNQRTPYNNLCPIDQNTGKRCITGCVATAMAQIMYYHKWPLQGTGSHSYECQGKTLTADFGATTYQWSKMKDTYTNNDSDPNDAVATLMYHCGVAVNMNYTSKESSAAVFSRILINYFNYSASTTKDLWAEYVTPEVFENTIYNELAVLRPVLISGQGSGGHQFICDGYQNGYFHFNFGWGGWEDDYYLLTAIDTDNGSYNIEQFITFGIQKPGDQIVINGSRYEIFPDGTALLWEGTATGNYTVPDYIDVNGEEYEVTSIMAKAFQDCPNLTSLTIPATVTSVGDSAFFNCKELKKVVLAESETPIDFGWNVFGIKWEWSSSPDSLREVNIGRDFTGRPFEDASKLSSVTLGEKVTQLPNYSFGWCHELKKLCLPAACRMVGDGAFAYTNIKITVDKNNPYLYMEDDVLFQKEGNVLVYYPSFKEDKEYSIPENVKKIAAYAFTKNRQLTQLTIPTGVKTIDICAFVGISNIITIVSHAVVPPTCSSPFDTFYEYINQKPFLYVPKEAMDTYQKTEPWSQFIIRDLATLKQNGTETINGITYELAASGIAIILKGQISGDCALPTKVIAKGYDYEVTAIGKKAFAECSNLTALTIPATVTSVGDSAFFNCKELKKVVLAESETPIDFGGNVFKIKSRLDSLREVSIGRDINGTPFQNAHSLSSVTLSEKVTQIPSNCFWGCRSLQTLTLPAACRMVGDGAFAYTKIKITVDKNNPYLYIQDDVLFQKEGNVLVYYPSFKEDKEYTIPDHVEKIAAYAFPNNKQLTQLTIPAGVKTIGVYGFVGISNITAIVSHAVVPPTCSSPSYTFDGYMKTPFLYVPKEAMDTYQKTKPWSQFIIRDLATLKPSGMETINGITYELAASGIATILKGQASGDCALPMKVTAQGYDYEVTTIGKKAFAECSNLTALTIPATVTSVGDSAFFNCTKLKKVVLADSNVPITFGYRVFASEANWYSTSIEEVYIGREFSGAPFEAAIHLQTLNFSDQVTSLPSYSFYWCIKLTAVNLPTQLQSIGYGAFNYCYSLTSITIPASITSIEGEAFVYCESLTHMYCFSAKVPETTTSAFDDTNIAAATLHVPASALNDYKNAAPWSGFGSIVPLTPEEEATAIQQLPTEEQQDENGIEQIITLDGKTVRTLQKGINIVKYKDGTTRKILLTR